MDNYEYTELLKNITIKMDNITGVVEPKKLQTRLLEIEELENDQDFWNDATNAAKVQKEKTFFGIHLWWYHDQGKDIDNIDKHPKAAAEAEKKTDEQFKRFKKEAPAINF